MDRDRPLNSQLCIYMYIVGGSVIDRLSDVGIWPGGRAEKERDSITR